ncbi:hypothetical protein OFY05_02900 [Pseudocitrobacter faecalis]|nr:hypothetical protein OFY05_02900 [Pseudocitrobacter faecalis]
MIDEYFFTAFPQYFFALERKIDYKNYDALSKACFWFYGGTFVQRLATPSARSPENKVLPVVNQAVKT